MRRLNDSRNKEMLDSPTHKANTVEDEEEKSSIKPARLTRQNLRRLGNFTLAAIPTSPSTSTSSKPKPITTSVFALRAYENGLVDPEMSEPPSNWTEVYQRLNKPRDTPSPPESQYELYVEAVEAAETQATTVSQVERLLKHPEVKGYRRVLDKAFTAFPDADVNDGLPAPQPDIVEGLSMNEYGQFPVSTQVPGAALYADSPRSITLPHLAGEIWGGTGKDKRRADLQSKYDGAALVYARNNALAYLQEGDRTTRDIAGAEAEADPTGRAEITTFTTDGNTLNLYAHYATPIEETEVRSGDRFWEYYQCPIDSTTLTTSYEEYKKGRRWMRNAQDHARDESHSVRDRLTEYWETKTAADGNSSLKRKASLSMSSRRELESVSKKPRKEAE